jgi:hypothetical protein
MEYGRSVDRIEKKKEDLQMIGKIIQAHIGTLVRIPVAGTLCALERMSATRTFLYIDGYIGSKGKYEGFLKFR